jgi:diguanylate cyclase (GGDEF)-like protein
MLLTDLDLTVNGRGSGPHSSGMGNQVISPRGAWRLGGALLIVTALTAYATALLLGVHTTLAIAAVTAVTTVAGLACLRVPWDRWDERLLFAVPVVAVVQVAIDVALVDYVLTSLFLPIALYIALVFPRQRTAAAFLGLIVLALLVPFVYSDQSTRDTVLWVLVIGPAAIFMAVVTGRLTAGLHTSREAYRRLSVVDGLTGVGNYRALMTRLHHETSRHARRNREFALLTMDLDGFKIVNESNGHLVGDALLAIVGSLLNVKVRDEDGVYRQGGDEFSVVAPETSREDAELLSRRIQRALRGIKSGDVRVSASIGTAVFPHDGSNPAELLDAADLDLRARKANPRAFSRFV